MGRSNLWAGCSGHVGPFQVEAAHSSVASSSAKSNKKALRGSIMSGAKIQDQKAIAREMFVQQAAHANGGVSASPLPGDTICSIKSRRDYTLESKAEDRFYEPADTSLLPVTRVDAANLIRALQQLEVIAKRQAPRIAFKAKGRILFVDLAEIVAVQAEGNYVSLRPRPTIQIPTENLKARTPLPEINDIQEQEAETCLRLKTINCK